MPLNLKFKWSSFIIILVTLVQVVAATSPGPAPPIAPPFKNHPHHPPIVLHRLSSKTPKWMEDMDVEVRKVDYHSQESLVPTLKDVHTVRPTPPSFAYATHRQYGTWKHRGLNINA